MENEKNLIDTDLNRFKVMKRGDIWKDECGDLLLIKEIYKSWKKDKKNISHVIIDAIILTANHPELSKYCSPGELIEDYNSKYIVEKIA